jgi:hypothetical protein
MLVLVDLISNAHLHKYLFDLIMAHTKFQLLTL